MRHIGPTTDSDVYYLSNWDEKDCVSTFQHCVFFVIYYFVSFTQSYILFIMYISSWPFYLAILRVNVPQDQLSANQIVWTDISSIQAF